jgi:thioredoxin reductase (NADPH)
MSEEVYDVIIIGGGPAGLSAGQYAARAKLKTLIIDKSSTAGALAYTSMIENYPGICQPMSGKELLDIFRRQALDFGAEFLGDTQVVGVSLEPEVKEIHTLSNTFKSKTVILATGSMGRKATIKGEAEFLGRGVSYCAICDANFFKGKRVCVLGDSEEAVKEAGLLAKYAAKVYLIAPAKKLKVPDGHPALMYENLEVLLGRRTREVLGGDVVEGVKISDQDGKEETLELEGVFIYIHGSKPVVDYLGGLVELSDEECIAVNRLMYTNTPGVFAAGDVVCTEVRQVVIAAANGCTAALSAEKFIHHRKKTRYDWAKST